MPQPGNLLTTAMAVMPHTDADRALRTALSLDVPFRRHRAAVHAGIHGQTHQRPAGPPESDQSQRFHVRGRTRASVSFSALAGYGDIKAKKDLDLFFSGVNRPRGIHLCGNPDWDFLLGLDLDILSLDVYSNGPVFSAYGRSIQRFLDRGGLLVWGVVPTGMEPFSGETVSSLIGRLEEIWGNLSKAGVDPHQIRRQGMLSPATCCLVNPDREKTVEQAFETVSAVSRELRERYRII